MVYKSVQESSKGGQYEYKQTDSEPSNHQHLVPHDVLLCS